MSIFIATLWTSVPVAAADISFKPSVAVSEEITDNIYELSTGKRTEITTRIKPGATFRYQSPFWSWDTAYTFEYRNYARSSRGNEYNHDIAVKGNLALVDNFLLLDLNDTYRRVSLDVARDAAAESSLFLNQTDQNIATVSPYLLWRIRGDNTLKTGYRFTDTRYWDQNGIEKQEHRGFADLTHEVSARFTLTSGYAFTRLESLPTKFSKHDLNGGFKYEYADKSFVSGQIGNSWQQFDSGINVSYLFWNAAVTHDLGFATATLDTRVAVTEDPLAVSTKETSYSGKLEKTFQRGMIGLSSSYSDFVNTATNRRESRRAGFTASGRYEVVQDLTANMSATGERFSRKITSDYPYRFTGTMGAGYALNNDVTLSLSYSYVTNLYALDTSEGSKDINKVVIEVKKAF